MTFTMNILALHAGNLLIIFLHLLSAKNGNANFKLLYVTLWLTKFLIDFYTVWCPNSRPLPQFKIILDQVKVPYWRHIESTC